jgi:hypothetical protein
MLGHCDAVNCWCGVRQKPSSPPYSIKTNNAQDAGTRSDPVSVCLRAEVQQHDQCQRSYHERGAKVARHARRPYE